MSRILVGDADMRSLFNSDGWIEWRCRCVEKNNEAMSSALNCMAGAIARRLAAEIDAKRMMAGALACRNEKRAERPVFADILAERGGFEPPIGD
ncbi:hypothetical protein [Burkholderia cepacia]|uniref:hypothetical protein n=1 Tax=Burkholderia cepacia TaxID=292 RepID=UPI0011BE8E2F|nr:hypothetical protein [Burkholderia cepacia]MCE4128868.1 hypothetical protein [Burkholderia cepacia]MDN7861303.1 hypothetical protein [Burkholderia cepacia]